MVRFRILGPLEFQAPHSRPLTATKPRLLLGLLLLYANQPVHAATLTDVLWPLKPPRTAAGALRTYVWTLRRSLPITGLTARTGAYQLDVPVHDLDKLLFEKLAEDGHRAARGGDPAGAADLWQSALSLWRGRPLDGMEIGAAAESIVADLAEKRLALLEQWARVSLELGRHTEVVPVLSAALADQPLRERLAELAMLALYRAGRQADALAAFRLLRQRLIADLGVEPGPALQRLHQQILAADPALDPPARGVASAVAAVPRQLPPDTGSFIGRYRELARMEAHLTAGSPLRPRPVVSISGAAGVGKSALAIHLAHRMANHFPDGQLYVDLQGATAGLRPLVPLEVLGRFLRALGARATDLTTVDEASSAFRAATAARRLLVVLDNAESVAQVRPLVPSGPLTAVVVTSRRALSALDGITVRLGLDVLSPTESVRLLSRLAGAERIAADPSAALRIAHWCGHLPLALRIAAARLAARPAWPIHELAERLSDARQRLDELHVDDLAVRSSFQVEIELLRDSPDGDERAAAAAFPVLALPDMVDLSVPAVAALLGVAKRPAERMLDALLDRALLTMPAPGRYRLHDLLRLFGRSQLHRPNAAAMTRLLRWYTAITWQAYRLLRPADPRPASAGEWAVASCGPVVPRFRDAAHALAWLETERPNLVAAIHQIAASADLPGGAATSLARALFAFFHLRGYVNDWVDVNETARRIAARTGDPIAEAHACRDLGAAFEVRGEYDAALACLGTALDRYIAAGDRVGEAACLNSLGAVHDSLGQLDQAAACLEQSLAICRDLGDPHSQGIALNNLGPVYCERGEYDRAEAVLRAALDIFHGTGNQRSRAAALGNLARVYERRGRYPQALSCYEECRATFAELGILVSQAEVLTSMGRIHRLMRNHAEALALLEAAYQIAERMDERHNLAASLWELGLTRDAAGAHDAARSCWRQALAIFEQLGVPEANEARARLEGD